MLLNKKTLYQIMSDAKTKLFRDQHQELLKLMDEISVFLNEEKFLPNIDKVLSILGFFSEKLKIHLLMEDNALYPFLMNSDVEELKHTAKSFYDEMRTLSDNFLYYRKKWPSASGIKKFQIGRAHV